MPVQNHFAAVEGTHRSSRRLGSVSAAIDITHFTIKAKSWQVVSWPERSSLRMPFSLKLNNFSLQKCLQVSIFIRMLSISTSYLVTSNISGADIVRRLAALDISEVELGYGLDEECFLDMREALNRSWLQVSSVHHFFPIPPPAPDGKGGGDVFLLSHPVVEERSQAVQWTKRSIEQESLGIISAGELLKRYHKNLVGMHIHDAGGLDDHLPPVREKSISKKLKPGLEMAP